MFLCFTCSVFLPLCVTRAQGGAERPGGFVLVELSRFCRWCWGGGECGSCALAVSLLCPWLQGEILAGGCQLCQAAAPRTEPWTVLCPWPFQLHPWSLKPGQAAGPPTSPSQAAHSGEEAETWQPWGFSVPLSSYVSGWPEPLRVVPAGFLDAFGELLVFLGCFAWCP